MNFANEPTGTVNVLSVNEEGKHDAGDEEEEVLLVHE